MANNGGESLVSVVGHLPRYVHTALAIAEIGRLGQFLGGISYRSGGAFHRIVNVALGDRSADARVRKYSLPQQSSMVLGEIVKQGLQRVATSRVVNRSLDTGMPLDIEAALRLSPRVDTVHFTAGVGRFLTRRARRQGAYLVCDQRSLHHEEVMASLKLAGVPNSLGLGQETAGRLEEQLRVADRIVCNSELTAASLIKGGYSPSKLIVVPPPTLIAGHPSGANGIRGRSADTVLYVGRFERLKGSRVLQHLVEILPPTIRFRIVGRVLDYEAYESLRWCSNVEFLGQVSKEKVTEEMRRCSLLVFPSWCDGWGMAVLEAMALGTPVLVSDRAGASEALRGEIDSSIISPEALDQWEREVKGVLQDPEYGSALSEASLRLAKGYSAEAYRARIREIYEQFPERS